MVYLPCQDVMEYADMMELSLAVLYCHWLKPAASLQLLTLGKVDD
jgi:hypothetical protein